MAGHIAGLGYSQRMDANGNPLAGCKLYIYDTGTSTPVTSYQDYALSIEHTHPIDADSAGIIPMFWVNDGTYRVRLTDVDGNEIFDDDGIVALGPSSGTGGGGSSVSATAIFQTGDLLWLPISGTRTGWVRANARTIGSAASGATERANADAEELFLYLWNNFSDSLCPVTAGRGGSAAADWAANKLIATLDMRSRGMYGLQGMGNTDLTITGGSSSAAAAVGASTVLLTSSNMPVMNITVSTAHLNITSTFTLGVGAGITGDNLTVLTSAGSSGTDVPSSPDNVTVVQDISFGSTLLTMQLASSVVSGSISSTVSGTIPLGGGGTGFTIQNRARVGTYYFKL
jgi:hypothetical protein